MLILRRVDIPACRLLGQDKPPETQAAQEGEEAEAEDEAAPAGSADGNGGAVSTAVKRDVKKIR